jgi:beta-N-acetylhexosaminidase
MSEFLLIDIDGFSLSQEDKELLAHPSIAGVILFQRNYHSKKQLSDLTSQIKKINSSFIIAVDQEGGRVQRFQKEFTKLPSMRHWGDFYSKNPMDAKKNFISTIELMIQELHLCGVNISFVPVLDIDFAVSEIIGERSFGSDPKLIIDMAQILITTLQKNNMPATGKHFPGHGGVVLDSHEALPKDSRDWSELEKLDLLIFKTLSQQLDAMMTAHIVFTEVDSLPVSFSSHWLQKILREQLNFQGVIISDDLTMKATEIIGNYENRAGHALEAGCDLLLVCNHRTGVIEILNSLERYHNKRSQERIADYKRYFSVCEKK